MIFAVTSGRVDSPVNGSSSRFAIDVHMPIADFDRLARQTDHPLDQQFFTLVGQLEHHDVETLRSVKAIRHFSTTRR